MDENFEDKADEFAEDAAQAAEEAAENLTQATENVWDKVEDTVEQAGEHIEQAAENAWDHVEEPAERTSQVAENARYFETGNSQQNTEEEKNTWKVNTGQHTHQSSSVLLFVLTGVMTVHNFSGNPHDTYPQHHAHKWRQMSQCLKYWHHY